MSSNYHPVIRKHPFNLPIFLLILVFLTLVVPGLALAQTPVLTQHNNNARTGAYTTETTLTPANVNVNTFGRLFSYPVDGRIYAQPLYVPNLTIPGKGTHNVIFVATAHDSIYAFDADSNGGSNSAPLWQITLLDAAHGAVAGATTVPNGDVSSQDVVPEIGIIGTPVIDLNSKTMYVVGKTKEPPPPPNTVPPVYVQRLHALDITTGLEKSGSPVQISGSVPGTGNGSLNQTLSFDPKWQMNRAGLLLQNGVVYLAYGSHGDNGPWHGWVFSYNASTLQKIGTYCTTPNGSGSGIWMAGTGLAADVIDPVNKPFGRLFIPTGNGTYDATFGNSMDYGDDIIRLDLSGGNLTVQDHFTPNNELPLQAGDTDVSSGGVLLLPDQNGAHKHLLVQAGKEGKIYLVDRDNMGGYSCGTTVPTQNSPCTVPDNVVQEIGGNNGPGGLWSAPAFWNNNLYTWGFISGGSVKLKSYAFANGLISTSPTLSPEGSSYPGATPSVSANGNTNGIVWALRTDQYSVSQGIGVLYAFDASNVANELYNSTQNSSRDAAGIANKFNVPTIANGKVYAGSADRLDVYGLLNATPTAATPVISPGSQAFSGSLSVTITDSTPGAAIFYTTDGSTPTTSSTQYTAAITVTSTQTITAIASASGFLQSAAASATYTNQNQVATPTFSPAATTFTSPISVTISDATAGAQIYVTTDGSTPTTASTLYSAPITISTTTTVKAIAAASGKTNSSVATATYTSASSGTGSAFVQGFSNAPNLMTFNGSTGLADSRLQLTNGGTSQAGSAWFNTPLNIQSFVNDFTFQIANPGADGFTFTIQYTGLTALGPSGGGLGYGPDNLGGAPGIGNSVAIKFDIYDNQGEGPDSTGIYTNGVSPTTPSVNLSGTGIDLHSGDTFIVHMVYNGTTLNMTITDGVTNASYSTSWTINIPQVIGSNIAYVGFTGGSGGLSASQKIETWTFTPNGSSPSQAASPVFGPVAGTYLGTQTVTISDSTSGASIFYTTDGSTPATSAGGSTLHYSGPITVSATETIKAIATASGYSPSTVSSATYTITSQAAAPTFNPPGGTFGAPQGVTLSTSTPGASIYYTLDGTTPNTTAGGSTLLYSSPLTISATTTVKAIAAASGFTSSTVSTATYTINASAGTINFGSGFAAGGMIFNGKAALNGARLRLTDGGTSEAATAWYSAPVNITSFTTDFSFQITPGTNPIADGFSFIIQGNNTTALGPGGGGLGYGPDKAGSTAANSILKSVAVKFDVYTNSGEGYDSTGLYTNGASPTTPYVDMTGSGVDLRSGHVFNVHMVYDGVNLAMTITDATTAGSFGTSWPVNIASNVGASTAYVGFGGGTGGYTAIQDIISWTLSGGGGTPTAATPTFSPAAGTYTSSQSVTISDSTSGASVYFTTDGSTPTTASTRYTAPIAVSTTTTIKALAAASGYNNSSVAVATYTIQQTAATPTFSPAAGTYSVAQSVTINDSTSGATIYYTTDGSTPTTSSTKYTTPVSISATTTLKAIATATGFSTSAVATAVYTINLPVVATPTFSPAAGTYASAQSVTISDATAGATIYYTTDGSTPTTASTKYTAPVSVSSSLTIKAIAVASGFTSSAVATSAYVIQSAAATPTFSPAPGTYFSAQSVTLGDATPGASIYYTTDSSTPTTSSTRYVGAFTVSVTTTVKAIAAASGFNNSSVAAATYTIGSPSSGVSFGSGFPSPTGLQFNGGSTLSGSRLRITDGLTGEGRSAFWSTPVNVQAFTTDFTFQQAAGTAPLADGFTFILQNVGPTALGPSGGGLGYGPNNPQGAPGIASSIALKFDLYDNVGEGSNSTGLYTNGASPTTPAINLTGSGVTLRSQHVMRAHVTYDGTTLTLTISDTLTGASFVTSWPINIPATIGSNTAYPGFAGGTGGYTAVQDIITWTFTPGAPQAPVTYSVNSLPATTSGPALSTLSYSGFPDGTGLLLNSTATGAWVTFTVNVAQPGVYDVSYTTQETTSRGMAQLSVNGGNLGPVIDQYASATTYSRFDLGNFNFAAAGNYSFQFAVTGKNASSTNYSLAFDNIILTPQ
jgi:hypothetical protein